MKKEEIEKVSFWNNKNIEMPAGHLKSDSNNDELVLFIVGFGGTFGELGDKLSDFALSTNRSFLWPMLEDTYDIRSTKKIDKNGNIKSIKIGATWASLKNTVSDFDAIFDYIKKCGYTKILLVSVCYGCSKSAYYMLKNPEFRNMVKKFVMLSPEDNRMIDKHPKNIGLKEEALHNLFVVKQNNILSHKFMGYMDISSKTYLDYAFNQEYNMFPYLEDSLKLKRLSVINMPVEIFISQYDRTIKDQPDGGNKLLRRLSNSFSNARYRTIKDTGHLFYDKEDEVVGHIKNFFDQDEKERER